MDGVEMDGVEMDGVEMDGVDGDLLQRRTIEDAIKGLVAGWCRRR